LHGAEKSLGLQITEGPHADTQELHIHAFRWFNRFLKNDVASQVDKPAIKFFKPAELRVFDRLPGDETNTTIQESFTIAAPPPIVPASAAAWESQRDAWRRGLRDKVFRGWPEESAADRKSLELKEAFAAEARGIRLTAWDFTSQHDIRLRLYVAHRASLKPAELDLVVLNALDQPSWVQWLASLRPAFADRFKGEQTSEIDPQEFEQTRKMFESSKWGMAWIAPRGIGPTAWDQSDKKQSQIRRRFQLLGQTQDAMRIWDVRRASQALRALDGFSNVPLWMQGERNMAGIVLYASLFEPNVARLDLWNPATTHRDGPDLLNVLRVLDLPAAVAMAAERSQVRLYRTTPTDWDYPQSVAKRLDWPATRLQIRSIQADADQSLK
jgi:hypothetical protein